MARKKFTLTNRKKGYSHRSKCMKVQIPRSKVMVYPLSFSLDLVKLPSTSRLNAISLEQLSNMMVGHIPPNWSFVKGPTSIGFVSVSSHSNEYHISFSVTIHDDFRWEVSFQQIIIPPSSLFIFGKKLASISAILGLLDFLDNKAPSMICVGNDDEKFVSLPQYTPGSHKQGSAAAVVNDNTIRHANCDVLVWNKGSNRCKACRNYRNTLRATLSRSRRRSAAKVDKHKMNDRFRTPSQLNEKLTQVRKDLKAAKKKNKKLTMCLQNVIERDGMTIDENTHSELVTIMMENSEKVKTLYPDNSFPHLFWKQQLQAATTAKASSMRWHPVMVRWCLYLKHISGKGYDLLRQSVCVILPSPRTLRDYTHYNQTTIGFTAATDKDLLDSLERQKLTDDWQKLVILLIDEVYIREDVVYNKHTGRILGLADVGDINNHLDRLEKSIIDEKKLSPAKTMLVFMVRGLCSSFQFPYAQFACSCLTGEQMYTPVTEAIFRLERLGLQVLGITTDGARSNRLVASLLNPAAKNSTDLTYKVPNPFSDEERPLYIFSDPPHFIKTLRNCISNKRRQLCCKGKAIKWEHIEELYLNDSGKSSTPTPGLSLVPKLKYEHVYLNNFSKMRVDLAAQVLSETVAKGLRRVVGAKAEGTAEMIEVVDKMFDCLNVTSCSEGIKKRKPAKDPYCHADDWRLKWLENDCLTYFQEWEEGVQDVADEKERNKMLLSKETRTGIEMTIKAFVELVRYIFTFPGVKYFLSERICQDPLEKFFGCQRQRGRVNENPSVAEFVKNTQALRVCGNLPMEIKGNCRGSSGKRVLIFDKENTAPLNKRRRKH